MGNNQYIEQARSIANHYYTLLSNDSIREEFIVNLDKELQLKQIESSLSPREFINQFLLQYYPNETTIKSSFVNNVLFKTRNHVSIFELNVGTSRVDLCKINRVSTAFEIKTELDNPNRLINQMSDYFQVFEKIYLICPLKDYEKLEAYIPKNCGIYGYYITKTGRYVFKRIRAAQVSENISPSMQLKSLTKRDLHQYFECPLKEKKSTMIDLILKYKSEKEINRIFKFCLRDKFYYKWEFLNTNRSDILEIDYQWFFKNNLSPKIVYL